MADEDDVGSKPLAASDGSLVKQFHEAVTVTVGSGNNSASFTVHTSMIKERSTFFESALSGRWETDRKGIELPEDDPAVFDLYLRCLYRNDGSIRLDNLEKGRRDALETYAQSAQEEVFDLYARVWILADKLGDCKSANLLILALIADMLFVIEVPGPRTIAYVWAHTRDGSPLRKLCVECWLNLTLDSEVDVENRMARAGQLLPYDFLVAIIKHTGLVRCTMPEYTVRVALHADFLEDNPERYCQYDHLCREPEALLKKRRKAKKRKMQQSEGDIE